MTRYLIENDSLPIGILALTIILVLICDKVLGFGKLFRVDIKISDCSTGSKTDRKTTSPPPFLRGLPFVGLGPAYFKDPYKFLTKARKEHGDLFYFRSFGAKWLFSFDTRDIEAVMKMTDKKGSLLKAYTDLSGPMLPLDNGKTYPNEELRMKFHPTDVSGTPFITHAVRPAKIRAWTPAVRDRIQKNCESLFNDGNNVDRVGVATVDLFEWCKVTIVEVTVRVLLGDVVSKNKSILKQWCDLFLEADPERAFTSPNKGFLTFLEVMIFGERLVYRKVRDLAYPIIDAEIESVIAGNPQDDHASMLSSLVRSWFSKLGNDAKALRLARLRVSNDLFNITFAAFSNSFASAGWCLWHIINDTNGVGQRIRNEMSRLEKDNDSLEHLSALDYPELEKCILEIGRLYTPGSIPRKVQNSPFVLPSCGHAVQPGETIWVPQFFTSRHPEAFSKPLEFDTSRYDSDRNEHRKAGNLFMPFGTGSHPCPGKNFANMEIAILVMEALRAFDWTFIKDADTAVLNEDEFTQKFVVKVPNHPPVNSTQVGFIYRPAEPIMVHCKSRQ